jgi:hypothetical protein
MIMQANRTSKLGTGSLDLHMEVQYVSFVPRQMAFANSYFSMLKEFLFLRECSCTCLKNCLLKLQPEFQR